VCVCVCTCMCPCVESKRLPLTAVDGAAGLSLWVDAFACCAHLQLPARVGGLVQSIGGAIRGRGGSGHGWARRARASSVAWIGVWVREGAMGGRMSDGRGEAGAPTRWVRAAQDTQCWSRHSVVEQWSESRAAELRVYRRLCSNYQPEVQSEVHAKRIAWMKQGAGAK